MPVKTANLVLLVFFLSCVSTLRLATPKLTLKLAHQPTLKLGELQNLS